VEVTVELSKGLTWLEAHGEVSVAQPAKRLVLQMLHSYALRMWRLEMVTKRT